MHPLHAAHQQATRREFLRSSVGIGSTALATLLAQDLGAATGTGGLPGMPHFAPQAKRVIYLLQSGAPSHVDLFDY